MRSLSKTDIKPILFSFGILLFLGVASYFTSPYLISAYFNQEPVYSVQEAQEYIKGHQYGKVIVVEGYATAISEDGFLLTEQGYAITTKKTDKMNCYPNEDGFYRIAGAWNPTTTDISGLSIRNTDIFYGVWILDGCN